MFMYLQATSTGGLYAGLLFLLLTVTSCSADPVRPPDGAPIEAEITYNGRTYAVIWGDAYEIDPVTGAMSFARAVYDKDFLEKNYRLEGNTLYRITPGVNQKTPVVRNGKDGFESATSIRDIIKRGRGWSSMTVQSPAAPTIPDYVRLRARILSGEMDFIDNRIDPSTKIARSGKNSLRFYATKPSMRMSLTKASLDSELAFFRKGDHFWFSGWFFLEKGRPTSILDLECSFINTSPGMRILLDSDLRPRVELKWIGKPTYSVPRGTTATLTPLKWVRVKLHLGLSDQSDGIIQLWIDGRKVIDTTGPTLPLPSAVYDRLQIGITANPLGQSTVLYVDDVEISTKPIY